MNTDSSWFSALVIILSAFLALFLIIGIVLAVKIVQIVKQVKRIVDQAEQVADRAEHISAFFEKTATPVAILKLVSNISETLQKKVKRK
jgi:predicted PurR-regulated permease PerM